MQDNEYTYFFTREDYFEAIKHVTFSHQSMIPSGMLSAYKDFVAVSATPDQIFHLSVANIRPVYKPYLIRWGNNLDPKTLKCYLTDTGIGGVRDHIKTMYNYGVDIDSMELVEAIHEIGALDFYGSAIESRSVFNRSRFHNYENFIIENHMRFTNNYLFAVSNSGECLEFARFLCKHERYNEAMFVVNSNRLAGPNALIEIVEIAKKHI